MKTFVVPTGTLAAGDRLELAFGLLVVAVNAADTLALAVRLGGVAGIAILTLPAALYQAGDYVRILAVIPVAVSGAGGTVHRDVTVKRSVLGVQSQSADHQFDLACPTNVARDVTVTATWSAADPGNQVDLRDFEAKLLEATA